MIIKICRICGKEFKKYNSDSKIKGRGQFCSVKCRGVAQGYYRTGKKASTETRLKFSLMRKGKRLGKDNTFFGKKHTIETRKKISDMAKKRTGALNPAWNGGITSELQKIRHCEKYEFWTKSVYKRDNFTCKFCGKRGGWLEAHHSKKSFKLLLEEAKYCFPILSLFDAAQQYDPVWDLDNGITLCKKCHNTKGLHHVK